VRLDGVRCIHLEAAGATDVHEERVGLLHEALQFVQFLLICVGRGQQIVIQLHRTQPAPMQCAAGTTITAIIHHSARTLRPSPVHGRPDKTQRSTRTKGQKSSQKRVEKVRPVRVMIDAYRHGCCVVSERTISFLFGV
jgi:hypothetical protein